MAYSTTPTWKEFYGEKGEGVLAIHNADVARWAQQAEEARARARDTTPFAGAGAGSTKHSSEPTTEEMPGCIK